MTTDFRALCAELVEELEVWISYGSETDCADAHSVVDRVRAALATPPPEPFVVRFYASDHYPSIKGNGFDGLQVGEDREEAEEFIAWVNKHCTMATPTPEPPTDEELYEYWISTSPQFGCADPVGFARAALERWGK